MTMQSILLFAVIAAGPLVSAGPSSIPTQASEHRTIYEALLKELMGGKLPPALVVQSMPLTMRAPSAADWAWFGAGTESLRIGVEAARTAPASSAAFESEAFPAGTQLIPMGMIEQVFRERGSELNTRWATFRERFNVQSFQGFSRPVLSADGLDALVYYSRSCGSLCGESGYAWLHRTSAATAWTVVKRLPKIVS